MEVSANCASQTRPEDCRQVNGGVKCVFKNSVCVSSISYPQSIPSFAKAEDSQGNVLKGEVECADESRYGLGLLLIGELPFIS